LFSIFHKPLILSEHFGTTMLHTLLFQVRLLFCI
jgi:hypothetical protein